MSKTSARQIQVGTHTVIVHVDADESGGNVMVLECVAPAFAPMPPPHSHDDFDETIFVLEDVMRLTLGGDRIDLAAGESLFIPRGVVHGVDNRDASPVRFLTIISPGLLSPRYFDEMADVLDGAGPPDSGKIGEIMRRHGITLAPLP